MSLCFSSFLCFLVRFLGCRYPGLCFRVPWPTFTGHTQTHICKQTSKLPVVMVLSCQTWRQRATSCANNGANQLRSQRPDLPPQTVSVATAALCTKLTHCATWLQVPGQVPARLCMKNSWGTLEDKNHPINIDPCVKYCVLQRREKDKRGWKRSQPCLKELFLGKPRRLRGWSAASVAN